MENEASTLCMYDGQTMTVAEYKTKPGVQDFENRLKELAMQSAYCSADRTSILTGELYPVFNPGFPTHQNRRCPYFEKYVLPQDPETEADYWAVMQGGKVKTAATTKCKRCSSLFTKQARNQLYCEPCRRENDKEKKRRYYHKNK